MSVSVSILLCKQISYAYDELYTEKNVSINPRYCNLALSSLVPLKVIFLKSDCLESKPNENEPINPLSGRNSK